MMVKPQLGSGLHPNEIFGQNGVYLNDKYPILDVSIDDQ
jgi:hypothetical protein